MANIADKTAQIRQAVYGKEVRESIASGIEAINTEVESTTQRQSTLETDMHEAISEAEEAAVRANSAASDAENLVEDFAVWEEYDPIEDYVPLNKVAYQGNGYINKEPCKGILPTNETYWLKIVSKGDQGVPGPMPNIVVGNTTTLLPGNPASVVRRAGSPDSAPILDFEIPRGMDGQGTGDMVKVDYDSNNDGKVDAADVADTVPDNTITDAKLSDSAGQIKARFTSHEAENASQAINVMFPPVPMVAAKGDYDKNTGIGTDDSAAFQAIMNYASGLNLEVYIPPKDFLASGLEVTGAVKISGNRVSSQGSRIFGTKNEPIIHVTGTLHIEGLLFMGSNNPAYSLQDGIFLDDCSNHIISDCFFEGCYRDIHIKDAVFYTTIERCTFYSAVNALIYGEGTATSGYQITINECITPLKTPNATKYGFFFDNAGTVTINDLEMSPTGCTDGGVVFNTNAVNAGIHQISHSRLEGSQTNGLQLIGTAARPIKFVFVSNTYIYGSPVIKVDYARNLYFDNCYFTGTNYVINPKYQGDDLYFNNCEYQVLNVPFRAEETCTSISYHIANPNYAGGQPFIYLPHIVANYTKKISVSGGSIGSNVNPISLTTYDRNKVSINVPGYFKTHNWGLNIRSSTGGGTYNIPHGLSAVPSYVNVVPNSQDAAVVGISKIEADATDLIVSMKAGVTAGTDNVRFYWEARV